MFYIIKNKKDNKVINITGSKKLVSNYPESWKYQIDYFHHDYDLEIRYDFYSQPVILSAVHGIVYTNQIFLLGKKCSI